MPFEKMNMYWLIRNIHRLEWAADTTDDSEWRKQHLSNRKYCIQLLLDKFNMVR